MYNIVDFERKPITKVTLQKPKINNNNIANIVGEVNHPTLFLLKSSKLGKKYIKKIRKHDTITRYNKSNKLS